MSRPAEITIKDWDRFQHYKKRNPPWIRLYRSLMDNPEWRKLPDSAARLLVELWLLASELEPGGRVPHDPMLIAWKTGRASTDASKINLDLVSLRANGFIAYTSDDASTDASKGTPQRQRTEDRVESSSLRSEDLWHVWIEELGGRAPHPTLTTQRKKKLEAFATEHLGCDDPLGRFRLVLKAVKASDHHMSERAYQMPESLFRNEERRDLWAQRAASNGSGSRQMPNLTL